MKKPNNKIRGVKAWAVIDKEYSTGLSSLSFWHAHWSKKMALTNKQYLENRFGIEYKIIPVLITPLPKRKPLKTK